MTITPKTAVTARSTKPPTRGAFTAALQNVLAHDLDRQMVLAMTKAGRELRYEELRNTVGERSKQLFSYAVDRMAADALLNRRLEPHGERYYSFLSATPRAVLVARILRQLARALMGDLADERLIATEVRTFFDPEATDTEGRSDDAESLFRGHRSAIQRVMDRRHMTRVVAFGSRARGDARPDSDLDLAARFSKAANALDLLAAERELEAVLGVDVHIVELPNKRLAAVIRREGVKFEPG